MTAQSVDDPLAPARAALDSHDWESAYEELSALDRAGHLGGAGFELLGEAAWWVQQPEVSVTARERAYAAYVREGDPTRAGYMALMAARDHHLQQSDAIAQGWWARATRVLKDQPESFAHGHLKLIEGLQLLDRGEFARAAELAGSAVEIGARFGDQDLQGFGLVTQGAALVRLGRVEEGLLLLDEATAAAVAGEFTPFATGVIYCQTISTCRDLADYRRAGQWTDVAERWCERQSINGFPGVCRVHRAEIMTLRGDWPEAEQEAMRASSELMAYKSPYLAAEGFYALGDVRLRAGNLDGADEAFGEAEDLGRDPQPGRALLYLARGNTDTALTSIERSLAAAAGNPLFRAKMLPAHVEIALAAGKIEVARDGAADLTAIAGDFRSPALLAAAHCATGAVLVASNEPELALQELTAARAQWQAVDAPYELARTRGVLATALRLLGEVDEAAHEADAARAAFVRLGAASDVAHCDELLDALRRRVEQGARERRTFMFTDIVGSTELLSVIGDEAWGDVKRWHDQALRAQATAHGGEEVNEAGDGFFFAFPDVRSAVDCAVAIQRELASHRREAGFAPRVRIGVHAAEATRVSGSYVGQGVHEAARIGALAGPGEIVASASSLQGEGIAGASAPRPAALKGIPEPVPVQTIEWTPANG